MAERKAECQASMYSASFLVVCLALTHTGAKAATSRLWIFSTKSGVLYIVHSQMSHFSFFYFTFNSLEWYKGIKSTFVNVSRPSGCSLNSAFPAVPCILSILADFKTYTTGELPLLPYLESCTQETAFIIYHLKNVTSTFIGVKFKIQIQANKVSTNPCKWF